MKARERIVSARAKMLLHYPFFGSILLRLRLVEDADGTRCDTCGTDGTMLIYHPPFIESLNQNQLIGLLAHEVMHIICLHPYRTKWRSHEHFNVACDFAINPDLEDMGFTLPPDGCVDREYQRNRNASEEIYSLLFGDLSQADVDGGTGEDGKGEKNDASQYGNGKWGQVLDGTEGKTKSEVAQEQAELKKDIEDAARQIGDKPGSHIPECVARQISSYRASNTIDGAELVKDFIDLTCGKRLTWSAPNRRHIWHGLYMPSKQPYGTRHVIICVDTSGSINENALSIFEQKIQEAWDANKVDEITVIYVDTCIRKTEEFKRGDLFEFSPAGGGGTDFTSCMETVQDMKANGLIFFTDLEVYGFGPEPDFPVLWAKWGRCSTTPPYGKIVEIESR